MDVLMRRIRGDGFEKMADNLLSSNFAIKKTFRFGFPELATCLASSLEHGLIAIANRHGMVKLLGKPGIEKTFWHPEVVSVKQMVFVPKKAQLLSLCENSVLYLWSLEEVVPEVLHKITFSQDNSYNKPSCVRVLPDSPWAYVGCEGSDVYVLKLDTMELASYVIHWNKLCGGYRQGRVMDILENPWDRTKVLIGFSEGLAVVWSLEKGEAKKFNSDKKLTAVCWGDGGKSFYAGYADGTVATWNLKTVTKPDAVVKPCVEGLKPSKHLSKMLCDAISGISMIKMSNGEQMLVVAGGDPTDSGSQSVSVFTGKGGTGGCVFALDSSLVDYSVMLQSNYLEVPQSPESLLVLCEGGLFAYSLNEKQLCTLHVPHPLDLHSAPVTCLHVVSNVSDEIISSMMSLQSKEEVEGKAVGKPLMLSGGRWSSHSSRKYSSEIVITGHGNGVIRMWNLVGAMFQPGLQIDTDAHVSKHGPKQQSSSLTPRMEHLLQEYDIIGEESVARGQQRKVSPAPEGGQVDSGKKPSKTQRSESLTCISGSQVGGAERMAMSTSTQSSSVFSWTGAKEDARAVVQVWFGFEDGNLVAVTADSCVHLYQLSTSPRKEVVKTVEVLLRDTTVLPEGDSSSMSPFDKEQPSPSPSQLSSKDSPQGELQFPPGFQLDLTCTVMHLDAAHPVPSPAPINSVVYSSKFGLLLVGLFRGLVVVDCQQASVLFTVTSEPQLRNLADPHHRRESAPVVAIHSVQKKRPIKRTKTDKMPSRVGEGKTIQVPRTVTCPDFVLRGRQQIFTVTDVKMTEMTVDRHSNQPVPVIWAATQDGLVAGIELAEISKPAGPMSRRYDTRPTGLAYEMRASVLALFAVSETGHQLPSPCHHWQHNQEGYSGAVSPQRGGSLTRVESPPKADAKPTSFLVVVSDSRLKIYDIHKIRSIAKVELVHEDESDFLYSASFCWIRETPCCVCLSVSGKVFVVALKNLRLVAEYNTGELLQFSGASTTSVSEMGRVFTFPNNQEIQVIALYKKDGERYAEQLPEICLEGVSSPTQPTPSTSSLFGGLLGRRQAQLNRTELFGSGSGWTSSVARTASGPASVHMRQDPGAQDGLTGAVQQTLQAVHERTEKLSEVEEKSERMRNAASDFEYLAQQLARRHS